MKLYCIICDEYSLFIVHNEINPKFDVFLLSNFYRKNFHPFHSYVSGTEERERRKRARESPVPEGFRESSSGSPTPSESSSRNPSPPPPPKRKVKKEKEEHEGWLSQI